MSRLDRKSGRVIVFLGPDGAGKSTLISKVCAPLRQESQVQEYYFAPGFLKRYRPKAARTVTTAPHEGRQYSQIVALAKVLLFLYEFRLGTRSERKKHDALVFDRYIHDLLVDPFRYRLGASRWWMRLLLKLAPQPDLAVIVTADAAEIQQRKSEVPFEETVRQVAAYRALAGCFRKSLLVENIGDPEAVARGVVQEIRALC